MWFKALFFGLTLCAAAQSIHFAHPGPNEALDAVEDVEVLCVGEQPARVELLVNGRRVAARTDPPFSFRISWDPGQSQTLDAIATYADGRTATCTRSFRGVPIDLEESVTVLQWFPFWEGEGGDAMLGDPGMRLKFDGSRRLPDVVGFASQFTLGLVVLLDVSGSMMPFIDPIREEIDALVNWTDSGGAESSWLIFDSQVLVVDRLAIGSPERFRKAFKGTARSVVWDGVAAASQLFSTTPRRILVLISDGQDDGSRHRAETVAPLLRTSQASLIWINPTTLSNRDLKRLARRSGGFVLSGLPGQGWSQVLQRRIAQQRYIEIVQPPETMSLEVTSGTVWYPRWRED